MSQSLFDSPGLQLPNEIYNFDSNVRIRKTSAKVNTLSEKTDTKQYSITDTEYLNLAKDPEKNKAEFQRMVDDEAKKWGAFEEKGNAKGLYHGTTKQFTVFDYFKSKKGKLGYGIYFSSNSNDAKFYERNNDKGIL